jgi:hypothetical protein
VYDRAEREVTPRLEAGVQTEAFAAAMAAAMKLRAELDRRRARLADQFSAATARWLHLINVPAAHDLTRLRAELLELDRRLRELTRQVDQAQWREETHGRAGQPGGDAGADPR